MKKVKEIINSVWEVPIFYKLLQATLAGGGHAAIKKYLQEHISKIDEKILDQGCGTGEYSLLFGNRYTGLDVSSNYIVDAQKKYSGTFIVGSAYKMQFPDNKFDVVFAVGLHHHLTEEQAKKAIKESLRVVKEGGKVLIVDAMRPKNKLNLVGLILRKIDRGGFVRDYRKTLTLLPPKLKYNYKLLSSYPFDYITIEIIKTQAIDNNNTYSPKNSSL
jgi:ubiquinone/menaquinone biosynthesis C-methylase UbiE